MDALLGISKEHRDVNVFNPSGVKDRWYNEELSSLTDQPHEYSKQKKEFFV